MKTKRIVWRAAKTVAIFLISVLVLSLLVFVVSRLAPGDPLVSFYGERAEKLKPANARPPKQDSVSTSRFCGSTPFG